MNSDTKFPELNLKFLKQYAFTEQQINLFNNTLNNPTFIDTVRGLFQDSPYNYIVSIKAYPFDVLNLYNNYEYKPDTIIRIGGVDIEGIKTLYDLKGVKGAIPIGEYHFNEYYGEHKFLNYSPYTKISVYVPFFGETILPVNEIMGHTIEFYVSVDVFTGYATLYVYHKDYDYIILSKDTKISIDISLGGTNASEINKNLLLNGTAIIGGAILAPAKSPISSFVGSQLLNQASYVSSLTERITRGSISDGFTSLVQNNKMYIIREMPNINIANLQNYKYFKGKPLMQFRTLGSLTGYTEVDDIHLEYMGDYITSTERDEIMNLLKSGVIM